MNPQNKNAQRAQGYSPIPQRPFASKKITENLQPRNEPDELLFKVDDLMIRLKIPEFHRKLVIRILMDMSTSKMRDIAKREIDALNSNQAIIQLVHRSIRARENCLFELRQEVKKLETPISSAKPGTFLYEQIVNESVSKVTFLFIPKTLHRFLGSFST